MQTVSRAYKNSIRQMGRNRGYIKISIGIVNTEAQKSMQSDKNNDLYYLANDKKIFNGQTVDRVYATCEQGFSKTDGTMFFTPKKGGQIYNNGLITKNLLGSLKISFGELTNIDLKGLMIDFSDCYPTEFSISNGKVTKNFINDTRYFSTEETFNGTDYLIITPTKMLHGQDRLRIFAITCGIANIFTNNELINYSGTEYVSSISQTVPSNDVSFTVDNKEQYYCPDDPDSALSYMEIGQEVQIQFGYDTNDDGIIEWLEPQMAYLSEWKADHDTASFRATDRFNNVAGTYYKGMYREGGISLYALAEDVLSEAGITDYYLDSYLEKVIVQNPMPVVDYSSALQIIANAGRCVLTEDRKGRLSIESSFIPKMWAYSEDEADYSQSENVLGGKKNKFYAEASKGYSLTNGSLNYFPKNVEIETGYVSEVLADENGNFAKNPTLTVELEATYSPYSLGIEFVNNYPTEIVLHTYANGEEVQTLVENPTDPSYAYMNRLSGFDKLVIEFIKGAPNSRVFVDKVLVGSQSDYSLEMGYELTEFPVATRQTKVKDVEIIRTSYRETDTDVAIANERKTVLPDTIYTVYFNEPCYNLSLDVKTAGITGEIVDFSNYFASMRFNVASETDVEYVINGRKYAVDTQKYVVNHNDKGENITWNNPLISTEEMAETVEGWLSSFYLGDLEYEVEWRGDPRVDANDLMYLDTVVGTVPIRSYQSSLEFSNAGWKGKIKARKVIME